MNNHTRIHYLEIVSSDIKQLLECYTHALNVSFSAAIPELGNAHIAMQADGVTVGIRAPMHEQEKPTTRPYYLVADIDAAVEEAERAGAEIAVEPMPIPGRGFCAIVMFNDIEMGFWQC